MWNETNFNLWLKNTIFLSLFYFKTKRKKNPFQESKEMVHNEVVGGKENKFNIFIIIIILDLSNMFAWMFYSFWGKKTIFLRIFSSPK